MYERTDKHINGYLPTYFELAAKIGTGGVVCEIGVQGGGSLELWQSLFPWGSVVGVDIDENATWPEGVTRVIANQTSRDLPTLLRDLFRDGFDLIVDDASHEGVATAKTFQHLWPLVQPERWYVIEDWGVGYPGAPMYDEEMRHWARDLVDYLYVRNDIESITYRRGLIIIQKTI